MSVGGLRRRIPLSGERSVGRGRDLWIIIVAAAVFSLIAMWSMPGFPAVGPGEMLPRHRGAQGHEAVVLYPGMAGAQAGFPSVRTTPMSRALDQARDSAMRPVPSLPPTSVSRPDMVQDRFVGVPGSGGQAHIPAHWERRLPDGESYVPPLTGSTPEGQVVQYPAGTYPPAERRLGP